ncbi:MAG: alpha/beta fold hydrolase [Candidatus Obscuribacterales bacterium]|nr:alpha/beta fold hydrolase [Candidatus Obscuribacterales bacterium]
MFTIVIRTKRQKFTLALLLSLAVLSAGHNTSSDAFAHSRPKASKLRAPLTNETSYATTTDDRLIGGDVPIASWHDQTVEPWAALLCIHGLGLHKESFAPLGKRLSALGIATYAMDVRGFGSWMNTKEHKQVDFEQTMRDVLASLKAMRQAHPDLPIVILGESMGGAIALQAAALYPDEIDGLVSCVPSGDRFGNKSTSMKVAMAYVRSPNKPIAIGKKIVKQASSDQELRQDWSDDAQARLELSPRELMQFQLFMNQNLVRAKDIRTTPTLIVQGANDRLVKPQSTIDIFNAVTATQKDLLLLGNSEHLIFEKGQFNDHVVDVLTSWIDRNAGVDEETEAKQEGNHEVVVDARNKQEAKEEKANDSMRAALGHLDIGRGYLMLGQYVKARDELQTVLELARGTSISRDADALLLTLPDEFIAPNIGPSTRATAEELKLISLSGAMANDKPSVLVFCAPWVESCTVLKKDLREILGPFASRVNVVEIDADDAANGALLTKYGISPLPAVLFLNGRNEVESYILGDDRGALRKAMAKIIDVEKPKD